MAGGSDSNPAAQTADSGNAAGRTKPAPTADPASPLPDLEPIPNDSFVTRTRLEREEVFSVTDLIGHLAEVSFDAIDDRLEELEEVLDRISEWIDEVRFRDTGDVREPIERAAILIQRGNHKEALQALDMAIQQDPESWSCLRKSKPLSIHNGEVGR